MMTFFSLEAGTKISITEANGAALYTLVHHNYNDGKALLLRDSSIGTSKWRLSGPSSYGDNVYEGSALDSYLEDTWYSTLPTETTKCLVPLDYPVADNNSGGSQILLSRHACTVSLGETGILSSTFANYNNIGVLDYTGTLDIDVAWWTRQPYKASNNAYQVTASGGQTYAHITNASNVRPTLGVSVDQAVEYSDELGAYVFATDGGTTMPTSGSYFYKCVNGELVTYQLYQCVNGELVQHDLYKVVNGELVRY